MTEENLNGKRTTSIILRTNYVILSCYRTFLVGHGTKKNKNKYFFKCAVTTKHNTITTCNKKLLHEKLFTMEVNDKSTFIVKYIDIRTLGRDCM